MPSSVDPDRPRLDVVGAVLSLVAVSAGVTGIIEGPDRGWTDPLTLAALVTGTAAGVAFVWWELRTARPMLDPRLFRLRGFSAGSLTVAAQFFAAFGFFFIVLQYLQFVVGYSPLRAAAALLPLPFVLLPVARRAPVLAQRIGFRRVAPVGLVLMACGFLVISRVGVGLNYWLFLTGIVLFAAGMGLAGTPATTAITESLPPAKQGVASAVNDTARELGSALGIALLGSVLNQQYRANVADAVHRVAGPDRRRRAALGGLHPVPGAGAGGRGGRAARDRGPARVRRRGQRGRPRGRGRPGRRRRRGVPARAPATNRGDSAGAGSRGTHRGPPDGLIGR